MTASGDLKKGGGVEGGVMTRSKTVPVLLQQPQQQQQSDKSSFTNKMYQVVSGFFSRHFLKK